LDEVDLKIDIGKNVALRPRLEKMQFWNPVLKPTYIGMLYSQGPGNGTALFIP